MHEKHKHFNSNSAIGAKNPIAEYPKIKDKKPDRQEDTLTIEELADPECSKHNESFADQKLSREVKYIGRNKEEPINILYNKEKIENYTSLDENILYVSMHSFFEPNYIIPQNFDISDEIYNPYVPVNINSSIHYSEEIDGFMEQDKLLSIA